MMLNEILKDVRELPTIMTLRQELDIIAKVASISDEELLADFPSFDGILGRLYESHTGGAIFEVNSENCRELKSFSNRLRGLAEKTESRNQAESLESVASALEIEFPRP
jgi:hypothetical protein